MKQSSFVVPAAIAAVVLSVTACTGGSSGSSGGGSGGSSDGAVRVTGDANTVNKGTAKQGGSITYVIERNIANWNPLGNDTLVETQRIADVFDPSTFSALPDLKTIEMNSDLLVSAEETSTAPLTVVYKINPKAVWSDGSQISVEDFRYTWASSDPRQCPKCATTSTTGYDQIKSLEGSDGGKTVTVTFGKSFGDWKSLFSPILPAYVAKTLGDDGTPAGMAKSFNDGFRYATGFPNWSGGPFIITEWQDNQAATLEPNPKWYGTKPTLDKLIFRIITDTTQEVPALANNEVQVINPQPQLDLLKNVQALKGINYQVSTGLQSQSLSFNLNHEPLKDAALRKALFTAVDVNQMVAKTVGQFDSEIKPLRSRFYVPQQSPRYEDNLATLGTGDVKAATAILTAAGYKIDGGKLIDPKGTPVPPLVMRYTQNNAIQQTESALVAADAKKIGLTIDVQTTDSLGETLTHKPGKDYDIVASAFFSTPYTASNNAQLYQTGAGLNFGGYSNPKVDDLIDQALAISDEGQVATLINKADKIISEDAYEMPLYQMPGLIAYKDNIVNIRNNVSYFGAPYNAGEWGLK